MPWRLATTLLLSTIVLVACNKGAGNTVTPTASDAAEAEAPPPRAATAAKGPVPLEIPDDDTVVSRPEGPELRIQLPPSPNFEDRTAPATYSDGAFSIRGLRDEVDQRVKDGDAGITIRVRAWVQEIYVPPTCPQNDVCPPPKQPHLWVTDQPDERGKRRAMLVANYRFTIPEWDAKRWQRQPEVVLERGKQYTFVGKFRRFSDTGFAHDQGLLEFVAVERKVGRKTKLVYPRGAHWHPIEVARQEKANADLAKKAAESARPR